MAVVSSLGMFTSRTVVLSLWPAGATSSLT